MQALQSIQDFLKGVKMDSQRAALLTGVACAVGSVVVLVKKISSHRKAEEKIRRAKNRREESLQRGEQAVLRYKELHPTTDSAFILTLSLSELTQQLKEGSLTPEDVLYSYMEKTLAVNKKLNCCTEILLESLDQLTTVGSNKDGLLYGVPVSVKENITFKNHDCSCGVVINLDQPAEKDSVLVQVLKK
uniref:Amidase domain-containing protein n=1 Tax=Haplochromis burtoni TaxID=8153 RepID=A0A3Q2X4Y1_HAPBU